MRAPGRAAPPGGRPPRRGPSTTRAPRRGRVYVALGVVGLLTAATFTLYRSDLVVRPNEDPQSIDNRGGRLPRFETQSLDGTGNNRRHPTWGQAGTVYARVGPVNYADRIAQPVGGPDVRYVSNRIFNDIHQNLFSETSATQWGFAWGQFVDHTVGLRATTEEEPEVQLAFDPADPMESFTNTLGGMSFSRSAAAPNSGTSRRRPRQQVNTVGSYLDASAVYSDSEERLEWLREGPVDGDMSNNGARLLLPDGTLPRVGERGDPATAPTMDVDGRLRGQPDRAVVAGDPRANENLALQATQTLFVREHNRIVGLLPQALTEEQKFQIARRVVIAEQQWITYNEFLPSLGVRLPRYRGYNPRVNAAISNEFATVGYRAHSMIHGEMETAVPVDRFTAEQLASIEAEGVEVATSEDGTETELAVPLNVAFFNPDLMDKIGLGAVLHGIGLESQYRNDEMIDNQLRSVMFQIPAPGNPACLDGDDLPQCFEGVVDLGALDVERGRDHGMPTYNRMREAYGLEPMGSFAEMTGEATEEFPADPELTPGAEIDDLDSLDFITLTDAAGIEFPPGDPEDIAGPGVQAVRRTPLAARLKAIYGSVDEVDAFVGMVAEAHLEGADMGELQMAMWQRQFRALRDGDRFFYGNDPGLRHIRQLYAIDFRVGLGDVIALNTDIPREEISENVFVLPPPEEEALVPAIAEEEGGT